MYIRFITEFKNEYNEVQTGVFQAAAFLRKNNLTYEFDKLRLNEIKDWFNSNLDKPGRFSRSRKKHAETVSLSWFKSSAVEHLKWMYELKVVLEKYDIVVEVIMRENPGYILFEDEYQVTTLPFKMNREKVK